MRKYLKLAVLMSISAFLVAATSNDQKVGKAKIPFKSNSESVVKGIQFQLNYDSSDLEFKGCQDTQNQFGSDFIFKCEDKSSEGRVIVLAFSMQGSEITNELLNSIEFDFEGNGVVELTGVIVANDEGQDVHANYNLPKTIEVNNYSPMKTTLRNAYPNPFNPVTNIDFDLAQAGDVSLIIYNLKGQQVSVIHNGYLDAKAHSFKWDASNMASGKYLARVIAPNYTQEIKLTLLK